MSEVTPILRKIEMASGPPQGNPTGANAPGFMLKKSGAGQFQPQNFGPPQSANPVPSSPQISSGTYQIVGMSLDSVKVKSSSTPETVEIPLNSFFFAHGAPVQSQDLRMGSQVTRQGDKWIIGVSQGAPPSGAGGYQPPQAGPAKSEQMPRKFGAGGYQGAPPSGAGGYQGVPQSGARGSQPLQQGPSGTVERSTFPKPGFNPPPNAGNLQSAQTGVPSQPNSGSAVKGGVGNPPIQQKPGISAPGYSVPSQIVKPGPQNFNQQTGVSLTPSAQFSDQVSLGKFPKPGPGKVENPAAKPGPPILGTPTQAFQQMGVSSPYKGGQNPQQVPVKRMAPSQVGKQGVPVQGKPGSGYPQMQANPGPAQSAVSPVRGPAMIQPQRYGTYYIRSVSLNTVSASEENTEPPVEIQISSITYQGQQLTASQLKPQMQLQWYQGGVFDLLTAPTQSARRAPAEEYKGPPPQVPQVPQVIQKPSNILAVTMFDSVFPGGNQWLSELKDFVINKYHGIYYWRASSQATSVAAYLLQCVLLEQVCAIYQNDPNNPSIKGNPGIQRKQFPRCIAAVFGMYDSPDPYSPTLKSPEFETNYQMPITIIENCISGYLNGSAQVNFAELANMVKVCITVFIPNGATFAKATYFPDGALDEEWQHMTLIGVPPYPVLVQKKMFSILDAVEAHITVDIKPYILKKKKFEPPKIDPGLVDEMKKLTTFNIELKEMTGSLLKFSQALLNRFETLLQDGSLDASFCSSDLGKSLAELRANLAGSTSLSFAQEEAIQQSVFGLMQLLNSRAAGQFWKQCDWCASENTLSYRDIVLDCGHSLCGKHINMLITNNQANGQAVITSTGDQTTLVCPSCNRPITKTNLETYDKKMVEKLLAESDNKEGLRICNACEQRRPNQIIWQLNCSHTLCVICGNNQTTYCKVCTTPLPDVAVAMSNWPLQCQLCTVQFAASSLCPVMCVRSHILCPACCFKCCKSKSCAVFGCGYQFSSVDLGQLRVKSFGSCRQCRAQKIYSDFLEVYCECQICFTCAIALAQEKGNFSICWWDSTPFSQEASRKLFEKMPQQFPCFLCGATSPPCGVTLRCGDHAHSDCLNQYASDCIKYADGRVDCKFCGIEVEAEKYAQIGAQDPQDSVVIEYKKSNPDYYEVHCPKCGPNSPTYEMPRNNIEQPACMECGQCSGAYCLLCHEEWNDFHKNGFCKFTLALQKIREMEEKKVQAVQCPYCKIAQPKDLANYPQTCTACTLQFCPECAARFDVIKEHGDAYHRQDCPKLDVTSDAQFKEKCSMCNILGEDGCQPPPRLARRRQFSPVELY